MKKKGKNKYVPPVIIDELDDIKREDNLQSDIEAWQKMTKYTRVGREAKRMFRFDWSKSKHLPKVEDYPFKRRKKRGLF